MYINWCEFIKTQNSTIRNNRFINSAVWSDWVRSELIYLIVNKLCGKWDALALCGIITNILCWEKCVDDAQHSFCWRANSYVKGVGCESVWRGVGRRVAGVWPARVWPWGPGGRLLWDGLHGPATMVGKRTGWLPWRRTRVIFTNFTPCRPCDMW